MRRWRRISEFGEAEFLGTRQSLAALPDHVHREPEEAL